jgi:hypothetical protein
VPSEAVLWQTTVEAIERLKLGTPNPVEPAPDEQPCIFLVKHRLTAMTEREYLAASGKTEQTDKVAMICEEVFREIVLPVIDAEVNEGKNFAELRQILVVMMFATWFKLRYKDHPKVSKFIDSGRPDQLVGEITKISDWVYGQEGRAKTESQESRELAAKNSTELAAYPEIDRIRASASYEIPENRDYFERYLEVFKNGVFYVEREELVPETGRKRARAYISGGIDLRKIDAVWENRVI